MGKLIETLGSKFTEHWFITLYTPSLIFWAMSLFLWGLEAKPGWYAAWVVTITKLSEPEQLAVLVFIFLTVLASAMMVQWFIPSMTKVLEGYWFPLFNPLKRLFVYRQILYKKNTDRKFQNLALKGVDKLTEDERIEFALLDSLLMQLPANPKDLMPTRFGNILRGVERRPNEKYALDAIVCWPRLWFILPEHVREEIVNARVSMNQYISLWIWCVLFLFVGFYSVLAVALSLIGLLIVYHRLLSSSKVYAVLIESAFDIYRQDLYKAMNWPLPYNPADELIQGAQLTAYLWRGSMQEYPKFVAEEKERNS